MEDVVVIVLVGLGIVIILGVVIACIAARKAPDGFEDDRGFHVRRRRKR